jgi:hypothetical protein
LQKAEGARGLHAQAKVDRRCGGWRRHAGGGQQPEVAH